MKLSFTSKIYIGLISLLLLFGGGMYAIAGRIMGWAVEPMLTMDFSRLKNLVDEAVRSNTDVPYAFILNERGKVLVHTFDRGFPTELKTANDVPGREKFSRIFEYFLETVSGMTNADELKEALAGNK